MLAEEAARRQEEKEQEDGDTSAGPVAASQTAKEARPRPGPGGPRRVQALAPPAAGATPETAPAPPGAASPRAQSRHPTAELEVVGSYQHRNPSGNRSKLWQYTVPPQGVFFDALRLGLKDSQGAPLGTGEWTGIDEPRQTAALQFDHRGPTGRGSTFRYEYDRAAFFIEPGLEAVDSSDEKKHELVWRWQPRPMGLELHVNGETRRLDAPGVSRLATATGPGALRYSVERFGPGVRLPLGGGGLGATYLRENFEDRTGFLPKAHTNAWIVDYNGFVTPKTTAFASFDFVSIRQDGLPGDAENRRTRLGVVSALLPQLTASAELNIEDFRKPNTFNAFVRDRDLFVTRLRYRPQPGLTLEGGYERTGLRRVNNAQTFIDTPRWDGGWLSLRAMPSDRITLFARHRLRRLSHAPPALIPELPSTLPLYYDDVDRTDAQLTFSLPRDALLTLGYWRDRRDNEARDVGFDSDMFSAALSMPLNRTLTFNADWSRQNWDGQGDALNNDPLGLNFGRPLTSDGEAFSLGLAYLPGRETWTLSLYRFRASGGEAVRSHGIALGYEPRWIGWGAPRLQIGWDDYDDQILSGFDYSDAFFRIDLARRF
jgi:hypothetical protein